MGLFNKMENFFENLHSEGEIKKENKTNKCPNCGASVTNDKCEYCGAVFNNDSVNINGFKNDIQTAANKFGKFVSKLFVSEEELENNLKNEDKK